jgi:hypothetical protein
MAVVYSIKGWGEEGYYYEVAQNRRTAGQLPWVAMSTRHDGLSLRRLMLLEDGPAIYGAWCLMVQVAAKCPVRGTLADVSGPLTAVDLSLKTGMAAQVFDRAFHVLVSKEIGWLLGAPATRRNGRSEPRYVTIRNVTKRNVTNDSPKGESCTETPEASSEPPAFVLEFPCDGPVKEFQLTEAKLAEYRESYPHIDVIGECRKALQWLRDNPTKRKTAGGMPAYLGRWLAKANDSPARASPSRESPRRTLGPVIVPEGMFDHDPR